MRRISCVKGCVVHGAWPQELARHVRVLINPANNSLTGPQRAAFPRGGPVPPGGSEAANLKANHGWDILYPQQAVDGLVHLQGGDELRAALRRAAPVLEAHDSGDHLRCRVGEAVLTSGVDGTGSKGPSGLPFDAIVHTVPPFWPRGDDLKEPAARAQWADALRSCYTNSFRLAVEFAAGLGRSGAAAGVAIATPVLGAGARGAPFAQAARVLADAAVQQFGDAQADEQVPHTSSSSLRVVVHSSSLGSSELSAVEAALATAAAER